MSDKKKKKQSRKEDWTIDDLGPIPPEEISHLIAELLSEPGATISSVGHDENGFDAINNMDFSNDSDSKKLKEWMEYSKEISEKQKKKNIGVVFLYTNHHRSPWLSLRVVKSDDTKLFAKKKATLPHLTAALLYFPEYWSPILPKVESVIISEEEPKRVSSILKYLDKRSWLFSDLKDILKRSSSNPIKAAREARKLLARATGHGKVLDPGRAEDLNLWDTAVDSMVNLGRIDLATDLYKTLFKELIKSQVDTTYYKGDILLRLGFLYLERNQEKHAVAMFTQALFEDLLHGRDLEDSTALELLRNIFGITELEIREIERIASNAAPSDDPRDLHSQFQTEQTRLRTRHFFDSCVVMTQSRVKTLLRKVREAKSSNEKKETLENLAEYIFECVDGFEVIKSKRTRTGEIDRIVRNNRRDHPLFAWIGPYFIVEAKNWKKKVGAPEIAVFINKVKRAQCTLGIALTRKGITGNLDKDAKRLIDEAHKVNSLIIVVFDENDLVNIIEQSNILEILRDKMEEVRFS